MYLSRALIGHGVCHHGHWSPLHSLSLPGSVTSGDNYHIMPILGDAEAHSTHSVSLVESLTPQEVVHLKSDSIISQWESRLGRYYPIRGKGYWVRSH